PKTERRGAGGLADTAVRFLATPGRRPYNGPVRGRPTSPSTPGTPAMRSRSPRPWQPACLSLGALVLGVLPAAGPGRPGPTVEKWADPKLPVTAGLELWLDAARASGDKLVPHDGKLEVWYDASGKGRHLRQPAADTRPTRLPAGASAVVR